MTDRTSRGPDLAGLREALAAAWEEGHREGIGCGHALAVCRHKDTGVEIDDLAAWHEATRAALAATSDVEPRPDLDRWAAWIGSQTRRTDWACRECVDADVRGQDSVVVPGFRCVWHEAAALHTETSGEPR